MKKAAELVFIPAPGMGHLVSTVEAAKLLINLDDTLSIIVLIIKATFKFKITDYVQSLTSTPSFCHRIRFIDLPQPEDELITKDLSVAYFLTTYIENHKPQVKEAVTTAITSSSNSVLAGFVIDMFCTSMIDVANEFGVPSYLFFTSGISILNFMFYVHEQNLDTTALKGSDAKLDFPGFLNPLPSKVLPSTFLEKEYLSLMVDMAKRFGDTKGIMVNSFQELESHALDSLSHARNIPPIYPVGPILNLKGDGHDQSDSSESDIMKWLDDQPLSSVVFLCFGSMGNLGEDQVKEIACALEQSGHRFLWSLRKPQPKGTILSPSDYSSNPNEVLPNGFLDRTAEIGKVIGWAPQVKILSHPAIGGFVSHCGWNSTLEGIWFGVPIAAWPLFAEQQWNAFQLVVELGLAVEIKMDYRNENEVIVSAEEIKRGIMGVMERDSGVRKRMKEMSEMSRSASVMGGGSSHSSLRRFISHVTDNVP